MFCLHYTSRVYLQTELTHATKVSKVLNEQECILRNKAREDFNKNTKKYKGFEVDSLAQVLN